MIAARILLAACAVAAAVFALFAAFGVYTETAVGPVAVAGAAIAALAVEGLVLVGVVVAAGWFAHGRIAPAIAVAVLFLCALPISLSTTAAWLASQDQGSTARRIEAARLHETATTGLASARNALAAYDARTAAATALYRDELARTPAGAATARMRIMTAIADIERQADARRAEYVRASPMPWRHDAVMGLSGGCRPRAFAPQAEGKPLQA